ncbi:MAG: YraN family protein [Candidatus Chisholmbacteria bacterium]|nr:YraN family protein [Candidatus Chisholmbacteria bacterium]
MIRNTIGTGKIGESLAESFLRKKGYKILQRNWRTKWGELDLVVQDGDTVVFVEVKTKRGDWFGTPEEMVNRRKIEKVRRMAEVYLARADRKPEQARFTARVDVVAIVLGRGDQVVRMEHYENVYDL